MRAKKKKKKGKGKRTRKWNCFATPVCRDRAWHNPNSEVAFVILSLRHKSFIIASERRGGGMGRILVVGRLKSLDRPYKALFYSCNSPTLTVNWQSIFYNHTKFSGPRPPISDPRPSTPSLTPSLAARWQIIFYSPPFILCRRRLFLLILLPQR